MDKKDKISLIDTINRIKENNGIIDPTGSSVSTGSTGSLVSGGIIEAGTTEASKASEGVGNGSNGKRKIAKPIYTKKIDWIAVAERKKEIQREKKLKEFADIELTKSPAVKEYRKRQALGEVIKKEVNQMDGRNVSAIAKITGMPNKQIIKLLTGGKNLRSWKKRQFRQIDIIGMDALKKLITIVNNGRVSVYQAGILFQMLRPMIFRSNKTQNPTTSINIGDNRKVSVYYPNFTPKDKSTVINAEE